MKKRGWLVISLLFINLILSGCFSEVSTEINPEIKVPDKIVELEGVIVQKLVDSTNRNKILVIPKFDSEDIKNLSENERVDLATLNGGMYFFITEDIFNEAEIGMKVNVSYNANAMREDSNPPNQNGLKEFIMKKLQ